MITLTETAAVKVKELLDAEGADDLALRVAVRPGGCSGYSYEMFFDGDVAADDEQAAVRPRLVGARSSSTRRPPSSSSGARSTTTTASTDAGFKITNPNATRTCGCGQSFS